MNKPKIGITVGDINGIGPEIIIKAFSNKRMLHVCTPVIYASAKLMLHFKNLFKAENFVFTPITLLKTLRKVR